MEHQFPLMKYFLIIHMACLQVLFAESGMRPRMGWQRGGDRTGSDQPPPLTLGRGKQASILPEERDVYSLDTGEIDTDPLHQGFGGFSRKKANNRDNMARFGRFNSDTHGCNGIQTRSCSSYSHCTGCLGLYTCNLSLGTCQLKGLSQRTDKFSQTLRDF